MRKIRNRKINSKKIIGLTSLILTGSLLTACTVYPTRKGHEYRRVEFNSNGNYYEASQFEPFYQDKNSNSFIYYDKWNVTSDGKYSRIVKEYDADNITSEDIRTLKDNKDLKIEDILGEPREVYEQIKDNISQEELEAGSYFNATIYSENEKNSVTIKNQDGVSSLFLIGCGIATFGGMGALIAWSKNQDKEENNKNKKLLLKKGEK